MSDHVKKVSLTRAQTVTPQSSVGLASMERGAHLSFRLTTLNVSKCEVDLVALDLSLLSLVTVTLTGGQEPRPPATPWLKAADSFRDTSWGHHGHLSLSNYCCRSHSSPTFWSLFSVVYVKVGRRTLEPPCSDLRMYSTRLHTNSRE